MKKNFLALGCFIVGALSANAHHATDYVATARTYAVTVTFTIDSIDGLRSLVAGERKEHEAGSSEMERLRRMYGLREPLLRGGAIVYEEIVPTLAWSWPFRSIRGRLTELLTAMTSRRNDSITEVTLRDSFGTGRRVYGTVDQLQLQAAVTTQTYRGVEYHWSQPLRERLLRHGIKFSTTGIKVTVTTPNGKRVVVGLEQIESILSVEGCPFQMASLAWPATP